LNGNPQFETNNTVSFKIDCVDQAETDRLWDRLSSNGGSTLQCGWLKDRYGFSWQIVPSDMMKFLGGPDSAGRARAMQAMMKMEKLDIATLQKAYECG
jgi:predicted 3-demethylubiquinone-9 3-methyltransferase (glyoxalase superfamily)